MLPTIDGVATRPLIWTLAAIAAAAVALVDPHRNRDEVSWRQSTILAAGIIAILLFGAKALFLLERYLGFGADIALSELAFDHGFRIPGGVLLVNVALPVLCLAVGTPPWRTADLAAAPLGIGIALLRVGCFFNGCCFGDAWSLGVRFPKQSLAFAWQLDHGLVSVFDDHTLPVHPLQLYFATVGVALFLLCTWLQPRKTYDGQVWFAFNLLFFTATCFLEFVRPAAFASNLVVCLAAIVTTIAASTLIGGRSFVECFSLRQKTVRGLG